MSERSSSPFEVRRRRSWLAGIAVFADGGFPLDVFPAGCAAPEPAGHFPQRLLEVDDHQEYGEDGAKDRPSDDGSSPVAGEGCTDQGGGDRDQQQQGVFRLDIIGHCGSSWTKKPRISPGLFEAFSAACASFCSR